MDPQYASSELQAARDQLIVEMEILRQRLASLEVELIDCELDIGPILNPSNRREERVDFKGAIALALESDELTARGINLSRSGICIETDDWTSVRLRYQVNGTNAVRDAQIAWMRRTKDGKVQVGLRFSGDAPSVAD